MNLAFTFDQGEMMAAVDRKATVLIADDDPEILTMLSIRLQSRGYATIEASDGTEAIAKVQAHSPDLVLLDVMMPGKTGWQVAKELRASKDFSNVGIIMLTAIGERVNEMTSGLYGADDHVDKPFDFGQLEAKISKVIEARRKQ